MSHHGIDVFLHELSKAGVSRIFGNPGTTELPLIDALAGETAIDFVLGLHEGAVMAMADGYAMASRGLGVVNLHASCGVGNAMGQLYNAHRQNTPLLMTAGQQDRQWRKPSRTSSGARRLPGLSGKAGNVEPVGLAGKSSFLVCQPRPKSRRSAPN